MLESKNPAVARIEGRSKHPVARLLFKLDQKDINPLASRIGEQFKKTDVPTLYGEVFNPGNWRSGHVSLKNHAILFVTLEKRAENAVYRALRGPGRFRVEFATIDGPECKKGKKSLMH